MNGTKPWYRSRTLWGQLISIAALIATRYVSTETLEIIGWIVAALGQAFGVWGRFTATETIEFRGGDGSGRGEGDGTPPRTALLSLLVGCLLVPSVVAPSIGCGATGRQVLVSTGTHAADAVKCLLACESDIDACHVDCAVKHGGSLAVELFQLLREALDAGAAAVEIPVPPKPAPVEDTSASPGG